MKKQIFRTLFAFIVSLFIFSLAAADDNWTEVTSKPAASDKIECNIKDVYAPDAANEKTLGTITSDDWSIGPEDAVMTILEYSDFQCPYCSGAGLELLKFQKAHADEVRYVYRHFPLSFHEKAPMAAYAADACGKQGLFFEAEEFLYSNQDTWSGLTSLDLFDQWLIENLPKGVKGLDFNKWEADYNDKDLRAKVDAAFNSVAATGLVQGTPTIFLNYKTFQDDYSDAVLSKYLTMFKLEKQFATECPAVVVENGKSYRAVLDTTEGKITMDLYPDKAPMAVNNFIDLALSGWYNNNKFNRVTEGFIAQTGDPTNTGAGYPGYYFKTETSDLSYGEAGLVGMAATKTDRNGSQFFITSDLKTYYENSVKSKNDKADAASKLSDADIESRVQEKLDIMKNTYTIFGKVTEDSLPIVQKLTKDSVVNSIKIEVK